MKSREYEKVILERLLRKYYNRTGTKVKRRVSLKPSDLYKKYGDNNADIAEKQKIGEAANRLSVLGYIVSDRLKFSEDIEKIYLCEGKLEEITQYMERVYGVKSCQAVRTRAEKLLEQYRSTSDTSKTGSGCTSGLVSAYCHKIEELLEAASASADPAQALDLERLEANLKVLDFIEHNKETLYLRELSMLVYGDSKWFETNNCDEICTFIRETRNCPREEDEKNDAVLAVYHILPPDQEIFIKGGWILEWPDDTLDIRNRKGGIALSTKDILSACRIILTSPDLLTVENKTSYQRLNSEGRALMYLGGYASSGQIAFLRKVFHDNPDVRAAHFGDIDVGGFLIHRHLCRMTGRKFQFYQMGTEQLQDTRYQNCLKGLTENDRARMKGLMEEEPYCRVMKYMEEYGVKLEQEIISYYDGKAQENDRKTTVR